LNLRSRVTCPHCWHGFAPDEIRWVAGHSELRGDARLGSDAPQRFLPTRFDVEGHALDVEGVACHQLACPRCHLTISRALLEMEPMFLSILGAPSSGKSYFLATMIWQLRRTLGTHFHLSFGDADPFANQILNDYEEKLFLNAKTEQLAYLPKTEREGDLYEPVRFEERVVLYPRPFVFSIQPQEGHPRYANGRRSSRALCLYDNAGEHFLPGGESANSPGTQHLSLSRVLLFLFDPTQHLRFRQACAGQTDDPQMEREDVHRQDQVLLEAANRIRAQSNLGQSEKYSRPLIVVVTKYDAWWSLTGQQPLKTEHVVKTKGGLSALDVGVLQAISRQVRGLLLEHSPEVVAAAESFSGDVTYIPVSSLGCGPEVDPQTGMLMVRPGKIRPMWAEVPMLYALHRSVGGLIPARRRSGSENGRGERVRAAGERYQEAWKETGS
jgi:hypothetical protein